MGTSLHRTRVESAELVATHPLELSVDGVRCSCTTERRTAPALVAAGRISEGAMERFKDAGLGYYDRRGRLRLVIPGTVVVDAPVRRAVGWCCSPASASNARTSALRSPGRAGLLRIAPEGIRERRRTWRTTPVGTT